MVEFVVQSNPTFRDLSGRFAKAEKNLLVNWRGELQSEGAYLRDDIRQRIRAKVGQPSKIEQGVKYRTRTTGDQITMEISAPGYARPHRIAAKSAAALSFRWAKAGMQTFVPRRGGFRTHVRNGALWVGKGYVDHPGGSLVPLVGPIVRDASQDWQRTRGSVILRRISTRYVSEITGG